MSDVSAESHVEQGENRCVSVFFAAGGFSAIWPLGTVDLPFLADVVVLAGWWCELMSQFIGNLFGDWVGLVSEPDALVGRVVRFFAA